MELKLIAAQRIRSWRRLRDIKQDVLAEMIGIDKSSLSKIENGSMEITLTMIEKIANALDIHAEILLFKDPNDLVPKKKTRLTMFIQHHKHLPD